MTSEICEICNLPEPCGSTLILRNFPAHAIRYVCKDLWNAKMLLEYLIINEKLTLCDLRLFLDEATRPIPHNGIHTTKPHGDPYQE